MTKPTDDQLKDLLVEITGKDKEAMGAETRFQEDLAMDSISLADLLASLEEDYEIIIEQEQAIQIKNLGQLSAFIDKL